MPLIGSGIRLEAFTEFMWQNVLVTPTTEEDACSSIGSGSAEGGMRLVEVEPHKEETSDEIQSYTTTAAMDIHTRHLPLANASSVIAPEARNEPCWKVNRITLPHGLAHSRPVPER